MAKLISDENIRLNIIVNGNPAQKELLDLEKETRKLNATQKDLRAEKARLIAAGKKESQEYKNITAELKTTTAAINTKKARMQALQKEIGITGLTISQLRQKASLLRKQLINTIPGGEAERKYRAELKAIENRLGTLSLKAKQSKLSISSIAGGFNKYAALGASAIATITGVTLGMQKMIDYNGKLSDAQSDVQKTTGLTKDEVDELTKSFGILNTRTSRLDLLKIAEEGGRIGIAKEEIGDFVKVMNQANVALGDSFQGGPEEVASKLGKLKLLFKETKDLRVDKAYNAIGSAINELGANGVATEANIADFTTRVGSLSNTLKPTIADALGLGAAFEESGVQAEISGRAYSIFLGQAAKESAKFAEVMGISTEEVENLINTNPTEFFLQFSERLAETQKTGTDTAKTMADLGLSADGVRKIVGAAGNNTERFREMLELSNKSMIDANSLTNEYNIKNNNLAATIEKVQKKLLGIFSSDFVVKGLSTFIAKFGQMLGIVKDLNEQIEIENQLTFENAKNNKLLVAESNVLLKRYEKLTSKVKNTAEETAELDLITLQLKDRLGESVMSIDAQTGSYKLNTEAVKKQIKLKSLLADEEAVTLISRRLRTKEQIKETKEKLKLAEKEAKIRLKFFKEEGNWQNGLKGRKESIDAVKKEADLRKDLNEKINREISLTKKLNEIGIGEDEADELFKPDNQPKEGDVKFVGNTKFVFKNGDWVPVTTTKDPTQRGLAENQFSNLIENTKNKALEEISINLEKDLEILNNSEASEKEKLKIQKAYAKARGIISKQEAETEKITVSQRLQVYSNMFAGIASLLGTNTKAGKAAAIAQATMNTYLGITEVWSTKSILPEPFATINRIANTAVVLGSGLASVRSIKSTQTPSISATGYEDGLYPVQRAQDGKMFNAAFGGETTSGVVDKPTVFMAGEVGPELIVDHKAFRQINPDVKNSFMREIARVKGFEGGLYNTTNITNVSQNDTDVSQNDTNVLQKEILIQLLSKNAALLESIEKNGIKAIIDSDLRNMKEFQKRLDDYNNLKNKNIK